MFRPRIYSCTLGSCGIGTSKKAFFSLPSASSEKRTLRPTDGGRTKRFSLDKIFCFATQHLNSFFEDVSIVHKNTVLLQTQTASPKIVLCFERRLQKAIGFLPSNVTMSQQFISRVVNYVANEILVKGLANSRTFQKFAVRTNQQYQEFNKNGAEKFAKAVEDIAKSQGPSSAAASGAAQGGPLQPPQRPLRGIPGFFLAFAKEVRKDLGGH